MTCPSQVALHGMSHSFIELSKSVRHDKTVILGGQMLLGSSGIGTYAPKQPGALIQHVRPLDHGTQWHVKF